MSRKRIVITGVGVLAPNGIGKEEFWKNLSEGKSGVKSITLFDTAGLKVKNAGEISEFNPKIFLGDRGLRTLDRSTKLATSAMKLALEDAGVQVSDKNSNNIGIVIGTTLGSIASISEFDKEALKEGPWYVNPALFPNTVINSPASQISIKFGIKGFNATISTGFSASLDAIKYAIDFLMLDRAKIVFAGGVEELCLHTFLGFYRTKFLAGLDENEPMISCPFDKRRNGIVLGEGACIFALEELESALERKANIYAEILGYGMSFDAYRTNKYNNTGVGLRRALLSVLKETGVKVKEIDYVSSAANSTVVADRMETEVIKYIFGKHAKSVAISSIKSMLGECFSASGALQLASSLVAINYGTIPPTINYEEKDPECDLDYVVNKTRKVTVNKVLIISFGPSGCNSSMIISRLKE